MLEEREPGSTLAGEEGETSACPRLGPALRFCFYGSDVQIGHPGDTFKAPPVNICVVKVGGTGFPFWYGFYLERPSQYRVLEVSHQMG